MTSEIKTASCKMNFNAIEGGGSKTIDSNFLLDKYEKNIIGCVKYNDP